MSLKPFWIKKESEYIGGYYFSEHNLYGFKNEKGEVIVEPKYRKITKFSEGYALAADYQKMYILNEKDIANAVEFQNAPVDAEFITFKDGLAMIGGKEYTGDKWAMIDKKGNFVTDYLFSSLDKAQISDLKTMVKLVQENGAKVLNWAEPTMLASKSNQEYIKIALKNCLKANAGNYIAKNNKIGFVKLVENEKATMQNIFNQKINSIIKENTTSCLYFGIVDEIIK